MPGLLPQNNYTFPDLLEVMPHVDHLCFMNSDNSQKPEIPKIYVCTNFRSGTHSSCGNRGSKQIFKELLDLSSERSTKIVVEQIVCLGQCEHGPNVRISGKEILNGVKTEDLSAIIDAAIDAGNGVD